MGTIKRETTKVLKDFENGAENTDTIYKEVRDTEDRIHEILRKNINVYVTTKGIVVTDFLNTYTFKNIKEAKIVYPNISSFIYA
jgi:hypothetical protein